MAAAVCTKCGEEYRYPNTRGSRLADYPSPCCHVIGKAHRYSPIVRPVVKTCPDCKKAGLWWRKALMNTAIYPTRPDDYHSKLYCPRCKKWVKPVLAEEK